MPKAAVARARRAPLNERVRINGSTGDPIPVTPELPPPDCTCSDVMRDIYSDGIRDICEVNGPVLVITAVAKWLDAHDQPLAAALRRLAGRWGARDRRRKRWIKNVTGKRKARVVGYSAAKVR